MAFALLTACRVPIYRVFSAMDQVAGVYNDANEVQTTEHLRYRPVARYFQLSFFGINRSEGHSQLLYSLKVQAVEERVYVPIVDKVQKLFEKWEANTGPDKGLVIDGIVFHQPMSWEQKVEQIVFEDVYDYSMLCRLLSDDTLSSLTSLVESELVGDAAALACIKTIRCLYLDHPSKKVREFFPGWVQHKKCWEPLQQVKKGHIYLSKYKVDGSKRGEGPVLILETSCLPMQCFALKECKSAVINHGTDLKKRKGKLIEIHTAELPLQVLEWLTCDNEDLRSFGKEINDAFVELAAWRKRRLARARSTLARLKKSFPKESLQSELAK